MPTLPLLVQKRDKPLTARLQAGDRAVEPKDVFDLAKQHEVTMVDLKFTDLPGTWQHMGLSLNAFGEEAFAEGIGFDGSSIRGFQEIYESDMLLMPDPATAIVDPFYEHTTLSRDLHGARPDHARALLARPALRRDEGRGAPALHRHRRHVLLRARRPSSTSSTTSPSTSRRTPRSTRSTPRRATGPRARASSAAARASPRSATRTARRRATSRRRRTTPRPTCAPDGEMLEALGIRTESHHHEVGGPGPGGDRPALPAAARDGRRAAAAQVRRQEHRQGGGQDRDVPAQADLRGERLGHARPPVAVEGRRDADARRRRLRAAQRPGAVATRRACSSTAAR